MNSAQTDYTASANAKNGEQLLILVQLGKALEERLEHVLAEVQLSLAKFGVLTHLVEASQAIPLSELAARVNCVRSNVTQMVDRLEGEGLVRRIPSPADRRIILAELSEEGRRRQAAGAERIRQLEAEVAGAIPVTDQAVITRAMRAVS